MLGESSTTQELYTDVLSETLKSICDGYSATSFAYGQTASGKTYTMMGSDSQPGIIRLAMKDIFNQISSLSTVQFYII